MNWKAHGTMGAAVGVWAGWAIPAQEATSDLVVPGVASVSADPRFVNAVTVGLVMGAYAIASDIDTHASRATNMWGPVSRWATIPLRWLVSHRGATHRLASAVVLTAAVMFVGSRWPVGAAFIVAVTVGLALAGLDHLLPGDTSDSFTNLAVSVVAGIVAYKVGWFPWWLPAAAGAGVVVHIAGDALTERGALGLIKSDGIATKTIYGLCLVAIVAWFATATGHDPFGNTVEYVRRFA